MPSGDDAGFRDKLVSCIEQLRAKREVLNSSISQDELIKIDIENKLPLLSMEVSRSNNKIGKLELAHQEVEQTIEEMEECTRQPPYALTQQPQQQHTASVPHYSVLQVSEGKTRYKGVVDKEKKYLEERRAKGQ